MGNSLKQNTAGEKDQAFFLKEKKLNERSRLIQKAVHDILSFSKSFEFGILVSCNRMKRLRRGANGSYSEA